MTPDHGDNQRSTPLDAFLDGQLPPAERERFDAEVVASPALAAEVALQQRIDSTLERLFAAEEAPAPLVMPRRRLVHPALLALAAAVLIVGASLWLFTASVLYERPNHVGPLYRDIVAAGFEPEIVCTTRDEFGAWVGKNYGQPLYPPEDPPGIEFVGWSYANVVSSYSGVLLARVEGEPVLVILDRREREDIRQGSPEIPGLTMHRRTIGDLVLYEVTPHGEARILPVLERE